MRAPSRAPYPTAAERRPPRILRPTDAPRADTLGMVDVADVLDDAERRGLCSPASVAHLKVVAGRGGRLADEHCRTALVGLLGQAALGRRREGFQCEALEAGTWRADLRTRYAPLLDEEPYIDLGEGWRWLLEHLLFDVSSVVGREGARVHLRRGRGLHVSFSGDRLLAQDILLDRFSREALGRSLRTCEVCGRGGFARDHSGVACDAHAVPRETSSGTLSAYEVANALTILSERSDGYIWSASRTNGLTVLRAGRWTFEFAGERACSLVRARNPDGRMGDVGFWRREIGGVPTMLLPEALSGGLADRLLGIRATPKPTSAAKPCGRKANDVGYETPASC